MLNIKVVEVLVGIFVAAGLAALFMLAMRVSNLSAFGEEDGYEIRARFNNIGGLKTRAPVRIGGVRIGHVTDIRYDSERYEAVVTMVIAKQYDQLPTDSSAAIFTSGLLGEQYIGLEPGADATYLAQGGEVQHTQSALVLEQLIGQFVYSQADKGGAQ